ncbi:MAG: choice-of-anchor D domain-containing protein, partial [bacterium]
MPDTLKAGDTTGIPVIFTPTLVVQYTDTLLVFNNDPKRNPLKIVLTGEGIGGTLPQIAVKPNPLDFGTVCGTVTSIITVFNKGQAPLKVDSLKFSTPAFSTDHATPFTVAPGDSEKIIIRFTSVTGRDDTGTLSIYHSDKPNSPTVVGLHGKGGVPDIAAATTIVFAPVPVQTCAGNTNSDTKMLVIHNEGGCDLVVDSLDTFPPFSLVTPSARYVIHAGDSLEIKLKFTPTVPGDTSAVLRIFSDDPDERPFLVTLRGHGLAAPDIDVTPLVLNFDSVVVGAKKPLPLSIKNVGALTLVVDSLVISSPVFFTETGEFVLDCNEDSLVTVIFAPISRGTFQATLKIYSNDPDENPVEVKLIGVGTAPIVSADPLTIDFGTVCHDSLLYTVLSNTGDGPLQVDSLVFSNSAFSTDHDPPPYLVAAGKRDTIRVRFTPVAGREDTGTLSIYNSDRRNSPIVVNLHGKGGVPDIAGAPEVKFDTVSVVCSGPASSARQTYVIRNVGICDLQIDTLTVTGDFSIISGGGARTIAPNDSASVVLQFVPSTPKDHVDTLKIASNDPDESPFMVVLRGVGVAVPTIAVEPPDTLDFGDVPVGSNKRLTIKITSRGAITLRVDSLVSSCRPVFTTEAGEFTLACGKDSSVTVAFSPIAPGSFVCKLSIYSNDAKKNPVMVTLRGNGVTGILAACKSPFPSPSACLGDAKTPVEYMLCNVGKAELTIKSMTIKSMNPNSGAAFQFVNPFSKPITLDKNQSTIVAFTFLPKLEGNITDT